MALGGDGLNAGDLDREIRLQVGTSVQSDTSGEATLSWADVTDEVNASGKVDAQWLPAGTKEAWQAQQRLGSYVDGVYIIQDRTIRPTPDKSRIIGHDGRIFDIKPYIEIGRGQGLQIPVVATDAVGDTV